MSKVQRIFAAIGDIQRLPIDFILVVAATFVFVCGTLAASISNDLYRQMGTLFFRYSVMAYSCIAVYSLTHFMSGLLNDPAYWEIMLWIYLILNPFGYLGLAFLVAGAENAKSTIRSSLTSLTFMLTGILIVSLFNPAFSHLQWTEFGWALEFEGLHQWARALLFLLCILSVLPLGARAGVRIKESIKEEPVIVGLLVIVSILTPLLLLLQGVMGSDFRNIVPLSYPGLFMLVIGLFLLLIILLFRSHPTILFAASHDLVELYIVRRGSGLPLYYFDFLQRRNQGDYTILSAFFTGIRQYVRHSLEVGDIERIRMGENEVLVAEGFLTYGILIATRSSDLLSSLLSITISEFEDLYGFGITSIVEPKLYKSFNSNIRKFFEFAMPIES